MSVHCYQSDNPCKHFMSYPALAIHSFLESNILVNNRDLVSENFQ
jgi:hypothetical protein